MNPPPETVPSSETWLIGIDIGGTFTDVVAVRVGTGDAVSVKVLTDHSSPMRGILAGLAQLAADHGVRVDEASLLAHATTLASNLVIERKGADTALLTTAGFPDLIETGREDRYDAYDLQIKAMPPLVRRRMRVEVMERMNAAGEAVINLTPQAIDEAIERVAAEKAEAVAICFLHSYANPDHEAALAESLRARSAGVFVTASAEVMPVIREYERLIATCVNAYIGPRVAGYMVELERQLTKIGFTGTVQIMKSNGGTCTPDEAARLPVSILESGPAAGVTAAAAVATAAGVPVAVAFDMGGTTAKASLIDAGEPHIVEELEVARRERFARGSGLPIRLPSVDLIEIGAGGGSIARFNELGLLQVGPESAGSSPGPACYGLGGSHPTVTDADLLLGYLDPVKFAGGRIHLDAAAAERSFAEHLGAADAGTVVQAAWGVHELVDENMAQAIRLHCVEHGVDPAQVTVIATGGGGPLHSASLLRRLGCHEVLCPRDAGVASALGLLIAPRSLEMSRTQIVPIEELDINAIAGRLGELERRIRGRLDGRGRDLTARHFLSMRVRGQAFEFRVPFHAESLDELSGAFHDEYVRRFGRGPSSTRYEIVTWEVRLLGASPHRMDGRYAIGNPQPPRSRRAYFGAYGWRDAAVFDRGTLAKGTSIEGPALLQEPGTTIVVLPEQVASIDGHGNVRLQERH
jgi:N-methylhydantoinase A/oxoprolinase/acetone carboxylase beta subunit